MITRIPSQARSSLTTTNPVRFGPAGSLEMKLESPLPVLIPVFRVSKLADLGKFPSKLPNAPILLNLYLTQLDNS